MNTPRNQPIRVLVAEDSPSVSALLCHVLAADPGIQVVGTAKDGLQAVSLAQSLQPDVITMDINMPGMDGISATRVIMETCPTRIVIVTSTISRAAINSSFDALSAGALAVVRTPDGPGQPDHDKLVGQLLGSIRTMAEVQVIRRHHHASGDIAADGTPSGGPPTIVAIGASTGGPPVLLTILSGLPRDFAVPVVIVQHIGIGFNEGFVDWLSRSSGFPTHVTIDNDTLKPGHAYVIPNGCQCRFEGQGRIRLDVDDAVTGHAPSVSALFTATLQTYGARSIAVLLTGMGRDGAAELKMLRNRGAVTITQQPETCIVSGMPGEAIRLGAAQHVLAPDEIAPKLAMLVREVTASGAK